MTTSPGRTGRLGASTRVPFTRTWPDPASAAAAERVRTTRACHSHLSMRWRSNSQRLTAVPCWPRAAPSTRAAWRTANSDRALCRASAGPSSRSATAGCRRGYRGDRGRDPAAAAAPDGRAVRRGVRSDVRRGVRHLGARVGHGARPAPDARRALRRCSSLAIPAATMRGRPRRSGRSPSGACTGGRLLQPTRQRPVHPRLPALPASRRGDPDAGGRAAQRRAVVLHPADGRAARLRSFPVRSR